MTTATLASTNGHAHSNGYATSFQPSSPPPPAPSTLSVPSFHLPPPAASQSLSAPENGLPLSRGSIADEKRDSKSMLHRVSRDFRSDTATIPTDEMFQVMQQASRGDDVCEEDETTNTFQARIAALTGKEAALFVSSGTLSNQLAIRTHLLQPPYSVVVDVRSHINKYEAGGTAFHCGAHSITLMPSNGHHLTWEDIEPHLVLTQDEVHSAPTKLICLENTLAGTIFPQEEIERISSEAHKLGIAMHVDGARLWNVAAETGTSIEELCKPFDTVNMCFSKGLGAPVGSILAGPASFIRKARHFRKLYGSGQRQIGCLSAAAQLALETTFPRLKATHELARYTQAELEKLGVKIVIPAETGMLWTDTASIGVDGNELVDRARALPDPIYLRAARMVFHYQIDPQAVVDFLQLVAKMKEEKLAAGFDPSTRSAKASAAPRNVYTR